MADQTPTADPSPVTPDRPPGLPDYSALTPDDVRRAVEAGIETADGYLAAARAGATGIDLLDRISDAARAIWSAYGQSAFLGAVHPNADVREAAETAGERIARWRGGVLRDARLLRALEGIDSEALDPEASAVRARWIAALRRAGAELDDASREELDSLEARVASLQAAFMANQAADGATIEVERGRLGGLPSPILDSLAAGTDPAHVVVPIELRQTVLERVADRGVRESIQRRWFEAASVANRPVLEELIAIHRRMAEILHFGSWAEARASAGTIGGIAGIRRFLDQIETPFLAARDRQLAAIRRPLAIELGIDEETLVLEDWDVPRGLALVRDASGADGALLRESFPLEAVLEGLGRSIEAVFGVRVAESADVRGWDPDMRRLDLSDVATGRPIGSILLDLFARDGKVRGIAGMCDILRFGSVGAAGERQPTHTAIVLFIARPDGGGEALLAPTDIEALFHELGHALDFMLGSPRFAPIDLDAWIADWSEAPSQSIGRWAALPDILARLGRDPRTGGTADLEQVRAFARANATGMALQNLRFLWFARLDALLHGPDAVDLDDAWRTAWPIRGTAPSVEGFEPGPLIIIALGYDGVMYGFLWAQALLEEILARFRTEGALSAEVGMAYRHELLEPGWAPDPIERMRRFLGREPTVGPYLEHLRGPG